MDIVLIVLWCLLVLFNGVNAGINFDQNHTGMGLMNLSLALTWTVVIVLKFVTLL